MSTVASVSLHWSRQVETEVQTDEFVFGEGVQTGDCAGDVVGGGGGLVGVGLDEFGKQRAGFQATS